VEDIMRRLMLAFLIVVVGTSTARAQLVVSDPAVTLRNALTALLEDSLLNTQRNQRQQIERMAQRLSALTQLAKYRLPGAPEWRIHDFESPDLLALSRAYHAALNYGDTGGAAYTAATNPVVAAVNLLGRLSPTARRSMLARLATLDIADATAIAGTNDAGRLRFNGRRELDAIEALEADVVDPSDEQSTAAILDKLSGAGLIGTRQREARTQLLSALLEQVLVDSKRTRDSEAATLNMQIVQWRAARAVNEAFVAGTGDALRTWRQR
jgi:hypothetical protein